MLYAFDCDGVLVDSEIIASQVDSELLTGIGFKISPEEVTQRFAGLTSIAIHDIVEKEIGRKMPDDFLPRQKEALDTRLARDLKIVSGAKEMLDRLKGPRCICSNSTSERLTIELNKVGLTDRFQPSIFSAVEVGDRQPKPSPNVYAYAAKTMDVNPREMVVLEDSVFGIRAAKAAGGRVIGFTGGAHTWLGHADLLIEAGAETVISRFADFPATAEALVAWEGME
ncbi:MAG TPA: HAD-IA family hydrolase [Bauldia sp.]|nr:HAD-IA family hydrolase [Bauldia sp.]